MPTGSWGGMAIACCALGATTAAYDGNDRGPAAQALADRHAPFGSRAHCAGPAHDVCAHPQIPFGKRSSPNIRFAPKATELPARLFTKLSLRPMRLFPPTIGNLSQSR